MTHVLHGFRYLDRMCDTVVVSRIDVEFNSYFETVHPKENTVFIPTFQSYKYLDDRFVSLPRLNVDIDTYFIRN